MRSRAAASSIGVQSSESFTRSSLAASTDGSFCAPAPAAAGVFFAKSYGGHAPKNLAQRLTPPTLPSAPSWATREARGHCSIHGTLTAMGDNPKLTYDEARLADDFLLEALDAFMCTGDADELGITTIVSSKQSARDRAVAMFARRQFAMGKRMQFARDAVLFAALAVEAAANVYVATMLPDDAERLDRLDTVDKLLVAPRLATGQALFISDHEPVGQVRILFKLRNRIVHPKLGKRAVVGEAGTADFTPRVAADCLVAAARTLRTLSEALPDAARAKGPGYALVPKHEPWLRKASRVWTDQLPTPPNALIKAMREAEADRANS
jgi:hypothetical protein